MSQVRICDIATGEVVHRVEVHYPKDSPQYDRMMDGLYRKVDFDRFYVDEEE